MPFMRAPNCATGPRWEETSILARACYHPGMPVPRREFLALAGTAAIAPLGVRLAAITAAEEATTMYGLIGKMTAVAGQRDALASMLLESTQAMPGCLSYIVAADPADADALWITEVWDSAASHQASLKLPAVQATIAKARPIIAGFSNRVETVPIGGYGLAKTAAR
jgi:quinol monooxygenase YgiN